MEPTPKIPTANRRSFFPLEDSETIDIGNGIIICRGYIQSVRPAIGRMLVSVETKTRLMYKPGRLIDLCLEFLGRPGQVNVLAPREELLPEPQRLRLRRFINGITVAVTIPGARRTVTLSQRVLNLSTVGARDLTFMLRDGTWTTTTEYYQNTFQYQLQFPDLLCIEVSGCSSFPHRAQLTAAF